MNLRDFIREALTDIVGAVEDAQNAIKNGTIVPEVSDNFKCVETGISNFQPIEFEVSVITDEKSGSEAKLSVVAAVVGGNIKGQSNTSSGHVAKLRFKIPVSLPIQPKEA